MTNLPQTFRDLDLRIKSSLAGERMPLRLILAALKIAHDDGGVEFVSLDELHEALEAADVSVKRDSLNKAIAPAGKKVIRRESGGLVRYRLAMPGRSDAESVLGAGDLELMYLDGTKPRTARREMADLLGGLKGEIRVCDPYYGVRSLETLELFPSSSTVRFLTARTNEAAAGLAGPLKDFKKERPKVELRVTNRPQDLHDRYVLTDQNMLIVGQGLKDIGAKESFVMMLPRKLAPDLLAEVQRSFDKKWASATPL